MTLFDDVTQIHSSNYVTFYQLDLSRQNNLSICQLIVGLWSPFLPTCQVRMPFRQINLCKTRCLLPGFRVVAGGWQACLLILMMWSWFLMFMSETVSGIYVFQIFSSSDSHGIIAVFYMVQMFNRASWNLLKFSDLMIKKIYFSTRS